MNKGRGVTGSNVTAERLKSLLTYDADSGAFHRRNGRLAGRLAGTRHPKGYCQIRVDGRVYLAHRLAVLWMTGSWPSHEVDHIDRNRSNNAWGNLRQATRQENSRNCSAKPRKYDLPTGVYPYAGMYQVQIRTETKRVSVGYFRTVEQAAQAYKDAARKFHGEFAP